MRKPFKPPTPEALLTKSIRMLLNSVRCFHWKVWQGMGSTPGVPDIIGIWQGKMLAIEIKSPKGKVSPAQEQFIKRINEAGGLAFVAWSLDDVIDKLGIQDRFLLR